jgi:hypothetical protein
MSQGYHGQIFGVITTGNLLSEAMKRLRYFITALLLLFMAGTASAQLAIGARGLFGVQGNAYGGVELSVQNIARSEFDLGWANDSWKFTGLKLFSLLGGERAGFYAGLGGGIGYYNLYDELYGTFAADLGCFVMLGRVQMGLDWRPEWYVINHSGSDVAFNLALSARLALGRGRD